MSMSAYPTPQGKRKAARGRLELEGRGVVEGVGERFGRGSAV